MSFGRIKELWVLASIFCLTQFFQLTSFTVLPYMETSGPRVYCAAILYLAFPEFFERISQNGYSLDKESVSTHITHIFLFIAILKKKKNLEENFHQKKSLHHDQREFRTLSNINDRAQSRYPFQQKTSLCLTGFQLHL